MKEVLSLATFALGALCFVTFVTTVKPTGNQRNPGGARPLPKGYFRYAGMRLAYLRSSVRRPQAAVTWRRRVGCEFDERQIASFLSPNPKARRAT